MSNATKRVLAEALKARLARQRLDEITIRSLVDDAEVSRKTFYYHFQDIYDLLEWVLVDEGRRILEGRTTVATWQQGLRSVFDYFQQNRVVILNIYRSVQQNNRLLEHHVAQLVRPMLEQIFEAYPGHERVTPDDRQFILDLYTFGLIELVLHWIGSGMKPDAASQMERIDRLFSGSMYSLIQRCIETRDKPVI